MVHLLVKISISKWKEVLPTLYPFFIFLLMRYCPRIKVIICGQNPFLVSVGFSGAHGQHNEHLYDCVKSLMETMDSFQSLQCRHYRNAKIHEHWSNFLN